MISSKIKNILIIEMVNRGFSGDAIAEFLERLSSLDTAAAKNAAVSKMRAIEEGLPDEGSLDVPMTLWGRETEFQEIFDTDNNKERYWLYSSGRGGGKSYEVGENIVKMTFEKGIGVLFSRYFATSVMTSIAPAFLNAAKRLGVEDHFYVTNDKIINKSTGSFIYLTGLHQSGSGSSGLKSLEGVNIVFVEEGEDLDSLKAWASFNKLDDSIRTTEKVNRVCIVLNPKSRKGQVYKNFIENNSKTVDVEGYEVEVSNRSDVRHIHISFHRIKEFLDSGWLYKEKVARIRYEEGIDPETGRKLTEEEQQIAKDFYLNNYIGIFNDFVAGRIFPYYETQEEFPDHLPQQYAIDFGYSHVDALVNVAVCLRSKKIYVKQCIFENGLSQGALATKIMEQTPRGASILADAAEPRLINDLRRATGRAISRVRKQEVSSQIQQMLDFTIVVCGDSEGIENELCQYRWSEQLDSKGRPKPNKADDVDNSIDAMRYALTVLLKDYERVGAAVAKPDPQPEPETAIERRKRLFQESLQKKRNLRESGSV